MREPGSSSLFLIGMGSMAVVLLTFPYWRPQKRPEVSPAPVAQEAPAATPRFRYGSSAPAAVDAAESLQRQMDRHARMENSGFYARVLNNPEIPEEVRSRFQKEKDRLDALAAANPHVAAKSREGLIPPPVREDGSFTPIFAEAVDMMKKTGVWDQMVENYAEQMERDANNPDLPESMRPTREQIEEVRRLGHIPTL